MEPEAMKLVTVAQMRAIEKEANGRGLTYDQMMENAGRGLADVIMRLRSDQKGKIVVGLVGPGNNGGDTLVALTELAKAGWSAKAFLVARKSDALVQRLVEAGGAVGPSRGRADSEDLKSLVGEADILLDGVLGTGTKLPLREEVARVLAEATDTLSNLHDAPFVVAVDCPSGVDCDTGEAAEQTIPADLTVTIAAVKRGLLKLPAFEHVGELKLVDIGIPEDLSAMKGLKTDVADLGMVTSALPVRPAEAHKGTFGTAVIVAGSINYTGAVLLAGRAAYRIGTGLVRLAVPALLHSTLAGHFAEATWVLLPHEQGVISRDAAEVLLNHLERATALLLGPGLGVEDTTRDFLQGMLLRASVPQKEKGRIGFVRATPEASQAAQAALPPVVVDAAGLKLLAKFKDWPKLLPALAILTPHPGEMAVLTGQTAEEIRADRELTAQKYAQEWGHVVVLKGAFSVIAAPDGRTSIIPVASPALARAGTGDVLAGLIVGLRAQGVSAYEAAVAGAWVHARAGLYAADDRGNTASVLAGDVLSSVSDVLADLE